MSKCMLLSSQVAGVVIVCSLSVMTLATVTVTTAIDPTDHWVKLTRREKAVCGTDWQQYLES